MGKCPLRPSARLSSPERGRAYIFHPTAEVQHGALRILRQAYLTPNVFEKNWSISGVLPYEAGIELASPRGTTS